MSTSQAVREGQGHPTPTASDETLPTLTTAVKDAKATRELMFTLRHFHLGDPAARERLERAEDDFLPALLDPYRDNSRLRYAYPLVLLPPVPQSADEETSAVAHSLDEWLRDACQAVAPEEGAARILKDHLPWIEHQVRQELSAHHGPVAMEALLAASLSALRKHLALSGEEGQRLESDTTKLLGQVRGDSQLLGYDRYTALHLLIHAVRCQAVPRHQRLQAQIQACIRELKLLFDVEWEKSDESIEPRMARNSIGFASNHFDPAALSAIMDHSRGTHQMPEIRRRRIEDAMAILESWKPDPVLIHFVHGGDLNETCLQGYQFGQESIDPDPCAKAIEIFDRNADQLAPLFSAIRIAELEIQGHYDPVIHDPWFANFHWSSFSQDELMLIPAVVALGAATHMAGAGLRSLSRLLNSGRPVQILVRVRPHNNPGAAPSEGPFESFRTELGYFGISHRQAVVTQSSPARHGHLLHCFQSSLETMRTSLHVINTGLRPPSKLVPLNAWLVAGAAIESRAHPFFRINPEAGDSAADRMEFQENPQSSRDWPQDRFRYQNENGEVVEIDLGFTFADYALLIEQLQDQFRVIPPECDSDDLVPVESYLSIEPGQTHHLVPFVWAVDANKTLHRLVVSIDVTNGARDRRNYWRALQEMAGIGNRYVERAIQETQTAERLAAAAEREALMAEHEAELARVRNQAAGEAMQRLTDMLLGLDTSLPAQPGIRRPAIIPSAEEPPADEAVIPTKEASETAADTPAPLVEEPWIDTPLCTSCNDCLKVNPRLFLYNEEKQARIGDPDQGPSHNWSKPRNCVPRNAFIPVPR